MSARIRLLPVIIFTAALTLTLKLGSIYQGLDVALFSAAVAEPQKEAKQAAKAATPADEDGEKKTAVAAKDDDAAAAEEGDAAAKKGASKGFDPALATDAEVEVLQRLADRRASLDNRDREMAMRETILQATERRIDAKIGELAKIKATIEGLLRKHDAEQGKKMKSLVKIYESMKPKQAARIFEQLEMNILLDVIERMREAKAAPIMANMAPVKAKAVTAALAARGTLPPLPAPENERN